MVLFLLIIILFFFFLFFFFFCRKEELRSLCECTWTRRMSSTTQRYNKEMELEGFRLFNRYHIYIWYFVGRFFVICFDFCCFTKNWIQRQSTWKETNWKAIWHIHQVYLTAFPHLSANPSHLPLSTKLYNSLGFFFFIYTYFNYNKFIISAFRNSMEWVWLKIKNLENYLVLEFVWQSTS